MIGLIAMWALESTDGKTAHVLLRAEEAMKVELFLRLFWYFWPRFLGEELSLEAELCFLEEEEQRHS